MSPAAHSIHSGLCRVALCLAEEGAGLCDRAIYRAPLALRKALKTRTSALI